MPSLTIVASMGIGRRPKQLVVYIGWEHFQHPGRKGESDTEPGMVKWLHLAGGYGHLRYRPFQYQPVPADRGVRVAVRKAEADGA